MAHEAEEDFFEFVLDHLAVTDTDADTGDKFLEGEGTLVDGFDAVVDEIDHATAGDLLFDGGLDDLLVEFGDDGVNGEAVLGWGFDDAEIADANQGHVEGTGDGGGREGEYVDVLLEGLEALFVTDAEALFFVDDQEAEVGELNVLGQDAVGADEDVDFTVFEVFEDLFGFLGVAETAELFDADGEGGEAALEALEVLEGEDGGGGENGDLFAIAEGLEGGAHGDFGFTEADVADNEAVHGHNGLHVALDVADGGELVLGGVVLEGVFKFALPVGVGGEGEAFGHAALGVELEQLVGHVLHPGLDAGFGLLPGDAAEFVEGGLGFGARAGAVFGDEVEAGDGDVELGFTGVFEQKELTAAAALVDELDAEEFADAVSLVDDEVAGLEIGDIGGEGAHGGDGAALVGAGHEIGGFKEVIATEEGELGVAEDGAAGKASLDEDDVGRGAGIDAVGEVLGHGFLRGEDDLVGDFVFTEDVSEAFDFAEGIGEEDDAMTGGDEGAGFLDGHADVAAEGDAGAGGEFTGIGAVIEGEFADFDFAQAGGAVGGELAVMEVMVFGLDGGGAFLEALPEAFGGGADLFGFVPDEEAGGGEIEQGEVAGAG